jgi:hypothetical protein
MRVEIYKKIFKEYYKDLATICITRVLCEKTMFLNKINSVKKLRASSEIYKLKRIIYHKL